MKPLLPKQHGAWAMLLVPFLLGITSSAFTSTHVPLFLGWLFLYLSTYPLLMLVKGKKKKEYYKWSGIYVGFTLLFLAIVLLNEWEMLYFGLMMIPLFFVILYFAKRKKERAFLNDVTAIIVFCIGGLASYYLGAGSLDKQGWMIAILCFLFFLGSTFFVKTMIREKKNVAFRWYSWSYHALLLILVVLFTQSLLFMIAFIPSVIRAFTLYGKKLTIMQLGVAEIVNSVCFLVTIIILV